VTKVINHYVVYCVLFRMRSLVTILIEVIFLVSILYVASGRISDVSRKLFEWFLVWSHFTYIALLQWFY